MTNKGNTLPHFYDIHVHVCHVCVHTCTHPIFGGIFGLSGMLRVVPVEWML